MENRKLSHCQRTGLHTANIAAIANAEKSLAKCLRFSQWHFLLIGCGKFIAEISASRMQPNLLTK